MLAGAPVNDGRASLRVTAWQPMSELVLVGWLDPDPGHINRFHPPDCQCSQPLRVAVHRPEHRIYQEEVSDAIAAMDYRGPASKELSDG